MRERPVRKEKMAVLRAMPPVPDPRPAGGATGSSAKASALADKAAIVRRSAARLHQWFTPHKLAMANIHSQKKRILRAERERLENRRYTSAIKTYFRRLESLVGAGDGQGAEGAHRELVSTIDKAVKRGALHRNNGARKKARAARTPTPPAQFGEHRIPFPADALGESRVVKFEMLGRLPVIRLARRAGDDAGPDRAARVRGAGP